MRPRFRGDAGKRRLIGALSSHSLLIREPSLAEAVVKVAALQELDPQAELITQGGCDSDIFLIIGPKTGMRNFAPSQMRRPLLVVVQNLKRK